MPEKRKNDAAVEVLLLIYFGLRNSTDRIMKDMDLHFFCGKFFQRLLHCFNGSLDIRLNNDIQLFDLSLLDSSARYHSPSPGPGHSGTLQGRHLPFSTFLLVQEGWPRGPCLCPIWIQ